MSKGETEKGEGSYKGGKKSSLESSAGQGSESDQDSESKSESKSGHESGEEAESEGVSSESESDSDLHEQSESRNKYESNSKSDSEQKYESLQESDSNEKNVSEHSSESESESVSNEASQWESDYEYYDSNQNPFGSGDWSIVSTEAGKLEKSRMSAAHADEEDESYGSFESVEMSGESVDEDYVEASFEPSRVSIRSENCNFRVVVVFVKMSSVNCSAVYCKQSNYPTEMKWTRCVREASQSSQESFLGGNFSQMTFSKCLGFLPIFFLKIMFAVLLYFSF